MATWRRRLPTCSDGLEPLLPLVERAEKNANTVIAQQKILTQVGQALRTINRQSSDLLEIAETVSSLKLQQNASPAEILGGRPAGDADAAHRQDRPTSS